ncbi:metal ABC transporter ATP-binding protein [Litchfieldia salsa]|uniref:Iron/zinc/copper transport system ATP-binding protein n=1 Tax=Litchfieldia salsa TaxID=930152 RepID=A0A1H0X0T6_9BACI|nr:metal ABC transporter ATP-binding protein [Litchfieldia salsa]SDP96449.1 iron/zinc/copper transport system ATP-binding protein [Litchfieldia salsa]
MKSALTVKELFVSYHGNEALKNINFSIEHSNLVGIIGPNGAGKSTLLKSLLNLIPKDKGDIQIYGKSFNEQRRSVAYVPQRNNIDWDFPITVFDTVLIGTYPNLGLFKSPKKTEREWAQHCLERVGMEEFSKRQIGELSGGQQQRVFLARALAQKSEIFYLDEPFVGIDIASEETIITILKDLKKSGKIILVVHHDLSKVSHYFDQLILLNKELIAFGHTDEVLQAETLSKAYVGQFSFLKNWG